MADLEFPAKKKGGFIETLDSRVENSVVGRYFHLGERKTSLSTEMRAGVVTFLTCAYILAVNSAILADTGGPCSDKDCTGPRKGPGCRFMNDEGYEACVLATRKSLVTATAATACISTFLMGAIANVPFSIMPGMGVNAYFAYTVVGYRGTGMISYQEALAAVFIEGWIFVIVSISGLRSGALSLVPKYNMLATAGGIGLFLAFIGLQKSEGLGVVVADPAVLVKLGGCPLENQVHMYSPPVVTPEAICKVDPTAPGKISLDLGPASPNYQCIGGRMHSPTMWLGIAGFILIVILMARKVNGAIMLGIVFVTCISWIPNHSASYLGPNTQIEGGIARMEDFKQVVSVPDASKTTLTWSFNHTFGSSALWIALITFLYLDFLDATGTMYSMATMIDKELPGFIDHTTKSFPRSLYAFTLDGIAIVIGSLLGCAPLTVALESAAGIKEGGRTGLTSIVTSFCYFIALFFTPLIVSIPPYATGPALVIVGAIMMESVADIEWQDLRQAIPAFLTIVMMPLSYSVAYGVIAGLIASLIISSIMLIMDLTATLWNKKDPREVLLEYTPEILSGRLENRIKARPFKSATAFVGTDSDEKATPVISDLDKGAPPA